MNPPGQGWPPSPPSNLPGPLPGQPGADPRQGYAQAPPVPVDQFRPQEVKIVGGGARGWIGSRAVKHPRLMGAGCIAGMLLLGGVNYAILDSEHEYYPQLLVLTPVIGTLGSWLLVFGQPIDPATGKPAKWWRFGAGAAMVIGVALGIALCVFVAA
jgi:hypothetical protein